MSQEKLGEAIGLTFQQVQKYERGSNRISAGTLFRLSQVLDVPVSFFFDGFDDGTETRIGFGEAASSYTTGDGISRRDARLLRLWRSAPPNIADEILALLSSLSPQAGDGTSDDRPPTPARPAPEPRSVGVAATDVMETNESSQRQRRRHGAVWDPADIYSSNRSPRKG